MASSSSPRRIYVYSEKFGTERILRINADGSIDPSFNAVEVGRFEIGYIWMLTAQPDGKISATGSFLSFAGSSRQKIVRL